MATDMERHYREVLARMKPGDKHFDLLDRQYRELRAALQLDCLDFDRFPKTETKVKEELARQADRYIEFGLNGHRQINMEQGKFKDSLIALACFQLENFAGRFDIPVAVLGQVPAKDIYKAAGVDYQLGDLDVRDWPDDPQGHKTPQRLYLVWMNTGVDSLGRKVEAVRLSLMRRYPSCHRVRRKRSLRGSPQNFRASLRGFSGNKRWVWPRAILALVYRTAGGGLRLG
ncbi:hypothetical protein A3E71_04450 [Candidatus Curtissbacteria bacterium RIFCSPHIGHO2_12_FULL_42_33]|nr:MAG: hypothetical protein A3E71_04450 [Candidatus Curtissbacteria bacterium RIFCSPHIGHO2_12_FULL_42_33]